MGGLPRRNTVIAEKRAAGELIVLDAGASFGPPLRGPAPSGATLDQRKLKAELIADGYALAGIDAMAVGAPDWSLGVDFVRELAKSRSLPVLAANLTCGG